MFTPYCSGDCSGERCTWWDLFWAVNAKSEPAWWAIIPWNGLRYQVERPW